MTSKQKALWVAQTGLFVALLVVVQLTTRSLSQYVTGPAVNLVLVLSVLIGGVYTGITVALLSPVVAFFLGIPAFLQLVPFIMLGNLAWVLCWHFVAGRVKTQGAALYLRSILALIVGAVLKFAVLYLGVVRLVIPFFLTNANDAQKGMLTAMFSVTQLFTAAIGGAVAILLLPLLWKIRVKEEKIS